MKKFFIFIFAIFAIHATCRAQGAGIENSIQISAGPFFQTGQLASGLGLGVRLSYGLAFPLGVKWSLQPGVGIGYKRSDLRNIGKAGGMTYSLGQADLFCALRYRLGAGKSGLLLGLAPDVSFTLWQGNANPVLPPREVGYKDGKKFRPVMFGLMPSIIYQFGQRWQVGLECNFGITEAAFQLPGSTVHDDNRLHTVMLLFGVRF